MKPSLYLILALSCSPACADEQLDRILSEAKRSRDGIKTYHIVANIVVTERVGTTLETQRVTIESWNDGKSLRNDVRVSKDKEGFSKTVWCTDCDRIGYVTTVGNNSDSANPVQWIKPTNNPVDTNPHHIDWKYFGLGHYRLYDSGTQFSYLDSFANTNGGVTKMETINSTRKITRTEPTRTISVSLDENANFNQVETRADFKSLGKTKVSYSKTLYSRILPSSIAYPSKFNFTFKSDDELISEMEVVVEKCELNIPIPSEVFQLKSFGIADGTPVEVPEIKVREQQPTWQNGAIDYKMTRGKQAAIVHQYRTQEVTPPVPDVPQPNVMARSWPYFVGAGLLAVVGLYFFRKRST